MGIKDIFSKKKDNVDEYSFDYAEPPFECVEFDSKSADEKKNKTPKGKELSNSHLPDQKLEKTPGNISAEISANQPDTHLTEDKDLDASKVVPHGNYSPKTPDSELPSAFDYTYYEPNYNYPYSQASTTKLAADRKPKFFSKPKPPINVIFLVIENTDKVGKYKDEVLSLAKRLIESNKNALFLLIQNGNDAWYSELLDFEDISSEKLLNQLLISDENSEYTADLMDAIKKINSFFKEKQPNYELKFKDEDYKVSDASVLFIGTGASSVNTNELKASFADHMKTLIQTPKVKSIKYFCMEDADTINAAALGFPVIGHIVSDFYKQGGK